MNKKKIIILLMSFIFVIIISLYRTFALNENTNTSLTTSDYTFLVGKTTDQNIIISSNSTKTFDVNIKNPYKGNLKYGLAYSVENDYEPTIGILNTSKHFQEETLEENETKTVSLMINNDTDNDIVIHIYLITGYVNGGDLILEENQKMITKILNVNDILNTNLDESGANTPKLTETMIPIYFDYEDKLWHKADTTNTNSTYQWYDYDNKWWANVALINSKNLEYYKDLALGDIVEEKDVVAYLVWIPRFKYQVWDIENTDKEENFYYNAYKNGINIVFENEKAITGTITCKDEEEQCSGENGEYYTHKAFDINGEEKEGFWIGKFETTGSKENPTIMPNYTALTFLNITDQINTIKTFNQMYLYDLEIQGRITNNLEWSAVAYLANSVYGVCNGAKNGCGTILPNNSQYLTTGSSLVSSEEITNFESYSYIGEKLDEDGMLTDIVEKNKVSSTTKNIYGVYDMVGGALENVMKTNDKENEFLKEINTDNYSLYTGKIILGELPYGMSGLPILEEEKWLLRGSELSEENKSIYQNKTYDGEANENVSFRITIS